ncbi:MAG: hypothetical protein IKM04_06355 [Clostridia bacterium]|nr:hypothetical protein [Clostridia bacterium]
MFKRSKLKKTISLFLVLTLFLAVLPSTSLAEEPIDSDDTVTAPSIYDPTLVFPDYAAATTYREKIAATQLPESFFERISTEDLVYIILCTPGISDVFVANDMRFGDALDRAAERYNVMAELETRDDSATALLEKYASLDFEAIANDNGAFSYLSYFSPVILELFLGRDVYFDRLTTEQKEELFTLAAVTAEKKAAYDVCGGGFANIFYENLDANASAYYAESVGLADPMGGGSDLVTIYTYGGLSMQEKKWNNAEDDDFGPSEIERINRQRLEQHGILPEWPPTLKYNCHSYAWCHRSPSNTVWINSAATYIQCSSSTEVSSPQSGNIVVYFSASGSDLHSGVVTSVSDGNVTVRSKWGEGGLYIHDLEEVPDEYAPTGYYVKYYSYPTLHRYDGWVFHNEENHQKACSLCRMDIISGFQSHSWTYSNPNAAYHDQYCALCDHQMQSNHVAASYTATTHTVDCDECGYYEEWEHNFRWTQTATGHTKTCLFCGYTATSQHHFGAWQSVDSSYHEKTCIDCDYTVSEAHTPNAEETRCTTCGALGPFASIMSRKPENCEIVLK